MSFFFHTTLGWLSALVLFALPGGPRIHASGQSLTEPVADSARSVDFRVQTKPPQVGLEVRVESRNGSVTRQRRTNRKGVASFNGLPRGKYFIVLAREGYKKTLEARIGGAGFQMTETLSSPPVTTETGFLGRIGAVFQTRYLLYAVLFILGLGIIALGVMAIRGMDTDESSSADTSQSTDVESKYEWEGKIGSGGMATIWLAKDSEGREVALKVMSEDMLDDEELVHKFIQEGKALERINSSHPDAPVVKVYEYGYLNGDRQPYLALEYLPDQSLEQVVEDQEALATAQALPVVKQVAVALSAAHANGIYHRDVKPENVIIVGRSSTLRTKLIDFGVARHEYVPRETMDGSLLGSPPYMSPEQAGGGEIGAASDIYSLGILAYALLNGTPPFADRNPLRVLEMHQEKEVPPLPDHVPDPVAQLIYRMLEKDPADRPSQTWEVAGRIDELLASSADHL